MIFNQALSTMDFQMKPHLCMSDVKAGRCGISILSFPFQKHSVLFGPLQIVCIHLWGPTRTLEKVNPIHHWPRIRFPICNGKGQCRKVTAATSTYFVNKNKTQNWKIVSPFVLGFGTVGFPTRSMQNLFIFNYKCIGLLVESDTYNLKLMNWFLGMFNAKGTHSWVCWHCWVVSAVM